MSPELHPIIQIMAQHSNDSSIKTPCYKTFHQFVTQPSTLGVICGFSPAKWDI